jgi:uncharacterized protein YvpB
MAVKPNKCLNCEKAITKGRSDKKFCDSNCKDEYNNAAKMAEGKEISKINTILKKNRRALQQLYREDNRNLKFTREDFIRSGFEFGFTTHAVVTHFKSNEITFCYDYGYREVEPGKYQIFHSFSKVKVKGGY